MKTFDELNKEMEVFKKEFQEKGKVLFNEILKSVWEEIPEINSFGWTQYTPYFNDGDECVFSVNEVSVVNGDREYDDADEWTNGFWKRYDWREENREWEIKQQLDKFIQTAPEDVLREIYGDHVEVIVFRDGTSEVEEYEHD